MAYVDVKLFHCYGSAALPVFTRSHDYKYCHSSLCPRHGAAIRDFRFGERAVILGSYIMVQLGRDDSYFNNSSSTTTLWHSLIVVMCISHC